MFVQALFRAPLRERAAMVASGNGHPSWFVQAALQRWTDPQGGGQVEYRAMLVLPQGSVAMPGTGSLPLAVYFHGLGETSEAIDEVAKLCARVALEPFVLVVPSRPARKWWFIDNDSTWGWLQGEFLSGLAALFAAFLGFLAEQPGIDCGRVGLFGYSAGAYAVVEVLAHGCIPLSGVGLGGVHGHGQQSTAGLPRHRAKGATRKFAAFLARLRQHQGVPWIEATHGRTDQESLWADAEPALRALDKRQQALGLPAVSIRLLEPEDQDTVPGERRNRTHHNYYKAAFVRQEFLVALLGGQPPPPQIPPHNERPSTRHDVSTNWRPVSREAHLEYGAAMKDPVPVCWGENVGAPRAWPAFERNAWSSVRQKAVSGRSFEWVAGAGRKRNHIRPAYQGSDRFRDRFRD